MEASKQAIFAVVFSYCALCVSHRVTAIRSPTFLKPVVTGPLLLRKDNSGIKEDIFNDDQVSTIRRYFTVEAPAVLEALLESARAFAEVETNGTSLKGRQSGQDATENKSVSELCLSHVFASISGLLEGKSWALQMLDAMGKPSPGIQNANLAWPGAYKLCLDVRATSMNVTHEQLLFSGQYCSVTIPLQTVLKVNGFTAEIKIIPGLCVPDSCSKTDVELLLTDVLIQLNVTSHVTVEMHPMSKPLDTKAIIAIIVCSVLLCLLVIGTCLDIFIVQMPKWRKSEDSDTPANLAEDRLLLVGNNSDCQTRRLGNLSSICTQLLTSFSVYTNGAKLLSTEQAPGSLTCIHGIRFLSMTWVVLGHCFPVDIYQTENSLPYYEDAIKHWTFQGIANAGVSVDTFFLLSGLLVTFLSLKEMKKNSGKLNWFLFYFHRFWRLTPPYILVLMVFVCLSPHWGYGPLWQEKLYERDYCETEWWTNLLYINNFVHVDKTCMGQSWYLSNDMQFYVLSPLIFVPLFFSRLWGLISAFIFLLATAITPGVLSYKYHFLPGTTTLAENNITSPANFVSDFYIKPYNRMGPYIVGMLGGYFLYCSDCKLRISKVTNLFLWAVATAAALAVLYGLYGASNDNPISLELAAFYNAVNRQVWAAAVCWVIVACVAGYGGFVNTLLSWSAFVPLSRLTYCTYLLHLMIFFIYLGNSDKLYFMSNLNLVMSFLAILVVSYMASFVASLAFEAPMLGLEKVLLQSRKRREVDK